MPRAIYVEARGYHRTSEFRVFTVTGKGEARGGFQARLVTPLPDYLQVEEAAAAPGG